MTYAVINPETLSPDTLEAELEARIEAHAASYRAKDLPRGSLDSKHADRLRREQNELEALCDSIGEQLRSLEQQGQHETGSLYLNFEPLLQRRRLYTEALVICERYRELEARLTRECNEVKEACLALAKQFLPYNLPQFEKGLEQFQDRCDQVADALDALEALHYDITPLLRAYEQWLALVERFGEILDERTEALKSPA